MTKDNIDKLEFHIHEGGQLNIALDNGHIRAEQNNCNNTMDDITSEFFEVVNAQECGVSYYDGNNEFEGRRITDEDIANIPDYCIQEYKRQLGTRVKGSESNLEILRMFLNEMDMTLQTGKRYDVMPIFTDVPRRTIKSYIFLNGCVMPFDFLDITECYWDAYEKYIVESRYYNIYILRHNNETVFVSVGYHLCFSDVTERLYGFSKAKILVNSSKIRIMLSEENRNVEIDTSQIGEDRDNQINITNYWIEQMERIDTIEKFYKIKFYLPKKASEGDYIAIDAIYNSLKGLSNTTLPPVPLKKSLLKKSIVISEEEVFNNISIFEDLFLFGYQFKPVSAFIVKCTLLWKNKIHAWESNSGGLPVRVEFACFKR